MSGGVKAPFWAQVAAVVLVVAVGLLCLPMGEDGLLINKLTGTKPEASTVPVARAPAIVTATPVALAQPVEIMTSQTASAGARFSQAVVIMAKEGENWTEGTIGNLPVWLDAQSGMVWGPRLMMPVAGMSADDVKLAKKSCAAEKPEGAWALPTAAEFDIAKVNGILKADSGAKHRWITWQQDSGIELPSVRGYTPAGQDRTFYIRCIARTPSAPENGYMEAGNEITLKALAE